jgi:hypothetical protein
MSNNEKTINGFLFKKYDEFWLSNLMFNQSESTFEIYAETLNESQLQKILSNFNTKISQIDVECRFLLEALSEVFWGHNQNKIFDFSGFVIDTTTDKLMIDFRMCYHCSGKDGFSDFANWLIDVKDFKIVGCSRQQL